MKSLTYLILIALSLAVTACDHPALHRRAAFIDYKDLLRGLYAAALSDFELQSEEVDGPSATGLDAFDRRDSLIVNHTDVRTVGTLLSNELNLLPARRGWNTSGISFRQNRFLSIQFEEGSAYYFMDFILTQVGENVEIDCLYKGVER